MSRAIATFGRSTRSSSWRYAAKAKRGTRTNDAITRPERHRRAPPTSPNDRLAFSGCVARDADGAGHRVGLGKRLCIGIAEPVIADDRQLSGDAPDGDPAKRQSRVVLQADQPADLPPSTASATGYTFRSLSPSSVAPTAQRRRRSAHYRATRTDNG